MKSTRIVTFAALALVLGFASGAVAQTVIDTVVKSGTVIGKTDHSVIVRMDDGVAREFEVPPGRTALVDGKEVGLADLKIGTTLSATFRTIARPVAVSTVTIKDGEVFKVQGGSLTTKEKDGFHTYVVPEGFKFLVNGRETSIGGLSPGMKLNATIVTTSTAMTTETKRGGAIGRAPVEPTPVPVAAAPAAPAPLPTTAAAPEKAPAKAAPAAAAAPATTTAEAPVTAGSSAMTATEPPPAPTQTPVPAPAASSNTMTIVIGLIVLVIVIIFIVMSTRKKE